MEKFLFPEMNVKIKKCDYKDLKGDFDLAIYDPPFNIWNTIDFIVNAKTYICFTNFQNRNYVEKLLGCPRFECIWYFKDGRWVSHNLPRITHESILIYGEIRFSAYVGEFVNDFTPKNKGFGCVGSDKLGKRIYIPRERKMLNSVIEVPRDVGKEFGVWGKPYELAAILLNWLCKEGDSIWDGFAGSGIFGIAAKNMNINYFGCDINHVETF